MSTPARAAAVLAAALLLGLGAATVGAHRSAVASRAEVAHTRAAVVPSVPPLPTAAPVPVAAPSVPAHLPASVPVRVEIPEIGVDSELMALGLNDDGSLEVPPGAFPAGWFTGAPTPGEIGPAVIAGHIDWVTGAGVFADLSSVSVGGQVRVTRTDGTVATFRVTEVAQYPKDAFPTERVYGDLDHAGLRLISCGGAFNRGTGHYEDNVVVYADLVP